MPQRNVKRPEKKTEDKKSDLDKAVDDTNKNKQDVTDLNKQLSRLNGGAEGDKRKLASLDDDADSDQKEIDNDKSTLNVAQDEEGAAQGAFDSAKEAEKTGETEANATIADVKFDQTAVNVVQDEADKADAKVQDDFDAYGGASNQIQKDGGVLRQAQKSLSDAEKALVAAKEQASAADSAYERALANANTSQAKLAQLRKIAEEDDAVLAAAKNVYAVDQARVKALESKVSSNTETASLLAALTKQVKQEKPAGNSRISVAPLANKVVKHSAARGQVKRQKKVALLVEPKSGHLVKTAISADFKNLPLKRSQNNLPQTGASKDLWTIFGTMAELIGLLGLISNKKWKS